MKKKKNKLGVFRRLEALYTRMGQEYSSVGQPLEFTCEGCPQNCCTSYFQHHTYVEWTYLWKGMNELPEERKEHYLARAKEYVEQSQTALTQGLRPSTMCPLNDEGLCGMYKHRLMICRMHGTRHVLAQRNGQLAEYPGCFRFEELAAPLEQKPFLNRTPLYRDLAMLEMDYLGAKLQQLPKVNLTLAEMLVNGPPALTP